MFLSQVSTQCLLLLPVFIIFFSIIVLSWIRRLIILLKLFDIRSIVCYRWLLEFEMCLLFKAALYCCFHRIFFYVFTISKGHGLVCIPCHIGLCFVFVWIIHSLFLDEHSEFASNVNTIFSTHHICFILCHNWQFLYQYYTLWVLFIRACFVKTRVYQLKLFGLYSLPYRSLFCFVCIINNACLDERGDGEHHQHFKTPFY